MSSEVGGPFFARMSSICLRLSNVAAKKNISRVSSGPVLQRWHRECELGDNLAIRIDMAGHFYSRYLVRYVKVRIAKLMQELQLLREIVLIVSHG